MNNYFFRSLKRFDFTGYSVEEAGVERMTRLERPRAKLERKIDKSSHNNRGVGEFSTNDEMFSLTVCLY